MHEAKHVVRACVRACVCVCVCACAADQALHNLWHFGCGSVCSVTVMMYKYNTKTTVELLV